MNDTFTFNLEDPPTLIRDSEYAACPSDSEHRRFIADNYRWQYEISRWRLASTFPEGYWDDDPLDFGDDDIDDGEPVAVGEIVGQTSVIKQWTGGRK